MNTLILSPHCDDAPLCAGAALATTLLGPQPQVVVLFSRSRFTKDIPCTGDVAAITELRNNEERTAAQRAGYRVTFAGFGEPFARPGFSDMSDIFDLARQESADGIWPEVIREIERLTSFHHGLVLAPLGCGGHIDHRIVKAAALVCCANKPHIQLGFMEDLPYSDELTDADVLAQIPPAHSSALCPVMVCAGLEEKLHILESYASQLSKESLGQVRNYWNRRGGERLWLPEAMANALPTTSSEDRRTRSEGAGVAPSTWCRFGGTKDE